MEFKKKKKVTMTYELTAKFLKHGNMYQKQGKYYNLEVNIDGTKEKVMKFNVGGIRTNFCHYDLTLLELHESELEVWKNTLSTKENYLIYKDYLLDEIRKKNEQNQRDYGDIKLI